MLTNTYMENPMTFKRTEISEITKEELKELDVLYTAINYNPASVHPDEQEKFTYLFVKSLSYVVDAG